MSLGSNIKNIRENRNITTKDISKKLEIFEKAYINIERGIKKPSDKILRKIASIFEMTSDDILNYDIDKANIDKRRVDLKNLNDIELSSNKIPKEVNISNVKFIPVEKPKSKDIISKKSLLLDSKDLFNFKNNLKLVGTNLFSDSLTTNENITLSKNVSAPRLLSYVEPYVVNGVEKTLFYTEVNTNYKVGDRVFILGGEYDIGIEDKFLRYKKGRDGYKVLFIDRCKIVLDINYTGILPFKRNKADDFINIYKVNNISEFKLFSRQISTRGSGVNKKFQKRNNNIIYTDKPLEQVNGWGDNSGISESGFYVMENNEWINVSEDFINGRYDDLASLIFESNGRIRINNGDINYTDGNDNDVILEEYKIYQWDLDNTTWVIDHSFDKSIITKSNFRGGVFKGDFNGGVYGLNKKKITWDGKGNWNLGTLLNTRWINGKLNSKFTLPESFISEFDKNEKPVQKTNGINNNGSGFNFLFKSDLSDVDIENGNIFDTKFGDSVENKRITEDFIKEEENEFNFTLNGGFYNNCEFKGGKVMNSSLSNCRSFNSLFDNITSLNSNFKNSVLSKSSYISDGKIKILDYDEFIYTDNIDKSITHKVFKFYISESSYNNLKVSDSFYIKKLIINEDVKYPLNFFNKRFKISTWTEYVDFLNKDESLGNFGFYKRGFEIGCFLSTPGDNEHKHTIFNDNNNFSNINISENPKKNYSVDILISVNDIFETELNSTKEIPNSEIPKYGLNLNNDSLLSTPNNLSLTNKIRDYVDISNAYIVNSDFTSGLISEVDWISGDHIEYNNDNNINSDRNIEGIYNINISNVLIDGVFHNILKINIDINQGNKESDDIYNLDDIIFLNGVEYVTVTDNIKLPDTYKIIEIEEFINGDIALNILPIKQEDKDVINNISDTSGDFKHTDSNNRYSHIHKVKFDKAKISEGIFRRSYIKNSFIENDNYDTKDVDFKNLENIKKMIISDSIFKDNNNKLSKATYMNSLFTKGSDEFLNGIIYNCNWNSGVFKNGVFKNSSWDNGEFNGGVFYNNKSFNASPNVNKPRYDSNTRLSYYKSGIPSGTVFSPFDSLTNNDRHSWKNGEFNGGEFKKSDFEGGIFNSGEFYNSNFYKGEVNGGVFGKNTLKLSQTVVYSGNINNIVVENALLLAKNPNLNIENDNFTITWNNGKFNDGQIGSDVNQTFTDSSKNLLLWKNGEFNGGDMIGNSIWENGEFNSGRFLSIYGVDLTTSNTQSDYAWQGGVFNGGVFGNSSGINNPLWYDGEFNGGVFTGKIWNKGVLSGGVFTGIGQIFTLNNDDNGDNANNLVDSYYNTNIYYGLWRSGVVSENKDIYNKNKKYFTRLKRNKELKEPNQATLRGVLWENGNFNHKNGKMENCVWLNGEFNDGTFLNSSFNPFVDRNNNTSNILPSVNTIGKSFNKTDNCIWKNGKLINSNFFYSKWLKGIFDKGNAYGMHWINGICIYMNANNIFWEDGIWKNGNWNGSYIDYLGKIDDNFYYEILKHGTELKENNDFHLWNIFKEPDNISEEISSDDAIETEDEDIILGDFNPLRQNLQF